MTPIQTPEPHGAPRPIAATSLHYRDSDGAMREVDGCHMTTDKAGRYWLWSDALESNLAHKAKTREDCLLEAIDSLLFTISLRDSRIAELRRIADLARQFADAVKPDDTGDDAAW